uniref:Uncharacterized protein n=1 Tax=Rhizophora mucronata TaxID=61149 RepID=A0A2P2PG92_RHIMU
MKYYFYLSWGDALWLVLRQGVDSLISMPMFCFVKSFRNAHIFIFSFGIWLPHKQ